MNYTVNNVQIRWVNDACYELKLPDGKGILIDPFVNHSTNRQLTNEDIEGAQYMLVSHTHFDHTMDIGELSEKFDSEIFVGRESALCLAETFDIPSYRITPVYPNETYYTDDFRLDTFWAKHIKLGTFDKPSAIKEGTPFKEAGVPDDQLPLNLHGSYEYSNFIITLKNGFRIMVWGGGVTTDALERVKKYDVDMAIVQFPRNTPDQIVRMCNAIHPQLVFPHHHEVFEEIMNMDMNDAIRQVQEGVAKTNPYTTIVNPVKGKWYQISTQAVLL